MLNTLQQQKGYHGHNQDLILSELPRLIFIIPNLERNIMNELINVTLNDNHEPIVSGRQLHEALGVKTPYDKWFPRMTEYGFTENEDFSTFLSESTGGRRAPHHISNQ